MFARRRPQGVTLKQMFDMGEKLKRDRNAALLENARFLYGELPQRLARRAQELDNLPYGLSQKTPVQTVRGQYMQSFKDVLSRREPDSHEDELAFTELCKSLLDRHRNVVLMAQGALELKQEMGSDAVECPFLQNFLDRFYMARIGLRVLMSQHVALHDPQDGYVGIIDSALSVREVAETAAVDCTGMCDRAYNRVPEVRFFGADQDLRIKYVRSHLHYMLLELIKNSMRAVVELHEDQDDMPPIDIVIADGESDVTIKVSDKGGGIPRQDQDKIWTYLYTTAQQPNADELRDLDTGWTPTSIMAGLGYGLPMCRLFARYFGGDLEIVSMHGHGTDAYLYINKLGDSEESLPI